MTCGPLTQQYTLCCRSNILSAVVTAGIILLSQGVSISTAGSILLSQGVSISTTGSILLSQGVSISTAGSILLSQGCIDRVPITSGSDVTG